MPQRQKWSTSATHTSPSPTTVMQWVYPAPRLSMPYDVENPNSASRAKRDHHQHGMTITNAETAPKHTHQAGSHAPPRTPFATPAIKRDTGDKNADQEPHRRPLETNNLNALQEEEETEAKSPSRSMNLERTTILNSTRSQSLPLQHTKND